MHWRWWCLDTSHVQKSKCQHDKLPGQPICRGFRVHHPYGALVGLGSHIDKPQ